MVEPNKPGEFQRRIIHMMNYEDGLWDITLGLIFLALGVYPITRELLGPTLNFEVYLAYLAIVVIALQFARRAITTPRIGIVKNFKSKARMMIIIVLILMVLSTLVLVILTLTSSESSQPPVEVVSQERMDYTVGIIAGLAVVVIFSLLGFVFCVRRMHLYGVLIGGGNLASTVLRYEYGYSINLPLVVASAIIILSGIYFLIHFLRKYPIESNEGVHAGQ